MISPSTSARWSRVRAQGMERADQGLAHVLKLRHVATDEGAPDPGVEAGQITGELTVGDQFSVGSNQPVINDRLGPLLETG